MDFFICLSIIIMAKVHKDVCIGCGTCCALAAHLFRMGEDGKAECYKQPETPEEMAAFEDAMNSCPVGAITAEVDEVATDASDDEDLKMAA